MKKLERFKSLIGIEKLEKISRTKVLVIGVGGVGGYTVESLARCGIGEIHIVDHDVVDETNINRQILALNSTIGKNNVDVMSERIKDIN